MYLPEILIRCCEKIEIVLVVPVIFGRDLLSCVVCAFELIRLAELFKRLFYASRAPEVMSVHMLCMRNRGCQPGVPVAVLQRFFSSIHLLIRMSKVVVSREVIWRK